MRGARDLLNLLATRFCRLWRLLKPSTIRGTRRLPSWHIAFLSQRPPAHVALAAGFADVDVLSRKLLEMPRYFHGVNATIDAIQLKRRGRGPDSSNGTEDGEYRERHCVLELQDGDIINRYTIPTATDQGNPGP